MTGRRRIGVDDEAPILASDDHGGKYDSIDECSSSKSRRIKSNVFWYYVHSIWEDWPSFTIGLLIGLVICLLAYFALKLFDRSPPPTYPCLTQECVTAAGYVLSYMNQTTNPCQDANTYACGQEMKRYSDHKDSRVAYFMTDVLTDKYIKPLTETLAQTDTCRDALAKLENPTDNHLDDSYKWSAMYMCYHQNCTRKRPFESQAEFVVPIIEQHFPFAKANFTKERETLSVAERRDILAERIYLGGYGDNPFFDITMADKVTQKCSLVVSLLPPFLLGNVTQTIKSNFEFYYEIVKVYDPPSVAFAAAVNNTNQHIPLKERAERLANFVIEWQSGIDNETVKEDLDFVKLKEIDTLMPSVNMKAFLKPYAEMAELDENSVIGIRDKSHFDFVSKVLGRQDNWEVINDLIFYDFGELHFLEAVARPKQSRWCSSTGFPWIYSRMYALEQGPQEKRSRQLATEMANSIRNTLKKELKASMNLTPGAMNGILTYLGETKLSVAYPDWIINDYDQNFRLLYGAPNVTKASELYRPLSNHEIMMGKIEYKKGLGKYSPLFYPFRMGGGFDKITQSLTISSVELKHPFFYQWNENTPLEHTVGLQALNYGSLGVDIALRFMSSLENFLSVDASAMIALNATKACYSNKLADFKFAAKFPHKSEAETIYFHPSEKHKHMTMKAAFSLRIALLALEEAVGRDKLYNGYPLAGVNLTAAELFFVKYVQAKCGFVNSAAIKEYVLPKPSKMMPEVVRLTTVLNNSHQFANAFKCTGKMETQDKMCRSWL